MKEPIKLSPFKHLCMTIGNLPSSYVDSMSYYECLLWLINYLQKTVIPAINENAEAVKEIQDWIKNLDIQDEVDNKLDEMAESGELEELLSIYLEAKATIVFDTVADMIASESITTGSNARTIGYYNKNDGVVSDYYITDTADSNTYSIQLNSGKYANLVIADEINVKQLGAYGDGIHDDTEAIELAFRLQNSLTVNHGEYVGSWEGHLFPKMYNVNFPRGQYIYDGYGIEIPDYGHLICIGESKMTTSIYVKKDIYLFKSNNHVNYLEIRNLCFSGGKGYYNQHSNSSDSDPVTKNITDKFIIENCSFYSYSKTAISSNFMDSPYWYINNNYFKGTEDTIAIAMPGDSAGSVISNNDFIIDKIHIKLQDGGRGVVIENNDFIRQTSSNNLYDILILPCYYNGVMSGGYYIGAKCVLTKNKFGAEYIKAGDYKIVIANQYAYTSDIDYNEETRFDSTNALNGQIYGIKIKSDNVFFNTSTVHPSIMYIAVAQIEGCTFDIRTNYADYLVEFSNTIVSNVNNTSYNQAFLYSNMGNILSIEAQRVNTHNIAGTNLNQYFYVNDEFNMLSNKPEILTANDPFYTLACSQSWGQPSTSGSVSSETYTDVHGQGRGTKATFTGAGYLAFSAISNSINKTLWIEFDIKAEGSIDKGIVSILNTAGGNKNKLYKRIPITTEYRHVQLYIHNSGQTINQFRFENVNGQAGIVYIENVTLYYSDTPLNLNGTAQLKELKLYNNNNYNASISIDGSNNLIVKYADGTTKTIKVE